MVRGTGAKNKAIFENCIIKNASIVSNIDEEPLNVVEQMIGSYLKLSIY